MHHYAGHEEKGFLGKMAEKRATDFRVQHSKAVRLYFEVNALTQQIFEDLRLNRDSRELFLAATLHKMSVSFQAAFLLMERGIDSDCKTLLRSLLESLFVLTASVKDPEFAQQYIRSAEAQRLSDIEGLLEHATTMSDSDRRHLEAELAMLQSNRDASKSNPTIVWHHKIQTRTIAETAGMMKEYKRDYPYFSKHTHATPQGLTKFLVLDEQRNVVRFRTGEDYDDAGHHLYLATKWMLTGIGHFSAALELPIATRWKELCAASEEPAKYPVP